MGIDNAICGNKDEPREYHIKYSKTDRERQISHEIAYMGKLNRDTNELIYKTEIDSQT